MSDTDNIPELREKSEEMEKNEVKLLAERRKENPAKPMEWAEEDFSCDNVTQISKLECQALVDFYTKLGGDKWKDKTNWLQSNEPCDWFGILCTRGWDWNNIRVIDMYDNNLSGTIPTSIWFLYSLEILTLWINKNQIYWTLPSSIGWMNNLETLDISETKIQWTIPESYGNLKKLDYFDLSNNKLSWKIPSSIRNLPILTTLFLHNNSFEGKLPSKFGSIDSIEDFTVSRNKLNGPFPDRFWGKSNLKSIALWSNNFCGKLPENLLDSEAELEIFSNKFITQWYSSAMNTWLKEHLKPGRWTQNSQECDKNITDPSKINPPVDEKNNDDGM